MKKPMTEAQKLACELAVISFKNWVTEQNLEVYNPSDAHLYLPLAEAPTGSGRVFHNRHTEHMFHIYAIGYITGMVDGREAST